MSQTNSTEVPTALFVGVVILAVLAALVATLTLGWAFGTFGEMSGISKARPPTARRVHSTYSPSDIESVVDEKIGRDSFETLTLAPLEVSTLKPALPNPPWSPFAIQPPTPLPTPPSAAYLSAVSKLPTLDYYDDPFGRN